ncbi:MAG TPA: hypothetical protein VJK03_03485 [Candidatus Nanoarchaeia archaeon]|nr:hypothetical protein [Candidatus Nanoarchaeia archaeon]
MFLMSESLKKTAPFKARLLSEHPKHERLSQTTAFKPWWRIVFLISLLIFKNTFFLIIL